MLFYGEDMREAFKGKIIFYAITIILLAAYLLILIRGSIYAGNDDAYYKFYISKDLAYYSRPDEFKDYREGNMLEYNASGNYRNQGRGWSPVDDEGTWCVGNESDFYLYIDDPEGRYCLTIKVREQPAYKNYIRANGEYQGDVVFGDDDTASVTITSGLREGLNRFSICTDDEVYDTNENRMYGDYDGRFNMYVENMTLNREGGINEKTF